MNRLWMLFQWYQKQASKAKVFFVWRRSRNYSAILNIQFKGRFLCNATRRNMAQFWIWSSNTEFYEGTKVTQELSCNSVFIIEAKQPIQLFTLTAFHPRLVSKTFIGWSKLIPFPVLVSQNVNSERASYVIAWNLMGCSRDVTILLSPCLERIQNIRTQAQPYRSD